MSVAPFNPATTPLDALIDALLASDSGLTVLDARYVGAAGQGGTYTGFDFDDGATQLSLGDGMLLTTGLATRAEGPNSRPDETTQHYRFGDADLNRLVGPQTFDANVLEIQFTVDPGIRSVRFDFGFGSEEFPEYVGSSFNDAFAVFLDGEQIAFDANGRPITVNNNAFLLNNSGNTSNP
ncbi:MAG: choice-of-anchor L domain-containing protein, partial [Pirellulales bacterium]